MLTILFFKNVWEYLSLDPVDPVDPLRVPKYGFTIVKQHFDGFLTKSCQNLGFLTKSCQNLGFLTKSWQNLGFKAPRF